jgi:transcription antitermination factor NusG
MTDRASEYFVYSTTKSSSPAPLRCVIVSRGSRKTSRKDGLYAGRVRLAIVPDAGRQVALWICRERSSVGNANVVLGTNLRVGQVVRVVAGPFVGGLGVLERLDGKGRVRMLLNILGG